MSYQILSVEKFGEELMRTGDLDPIYIALNNSHYPPNLKYRWMVAYLCFYHAGFACYACVFMGSKFWELMMKAAVNEEPAPHGGRWPRASERRHFRGQQAIRAVQELADKYPTPENMVHWIAVHSEREIVHDGTSKTHRSIAGVFQAVKTHRGFGDWVAFKMADLMNNCTEYPVTFGNGHVFMFDTPVKGAELAFHGWKEAKRIPVNFCPIRVTDYVTEHLIKYYDSRGVMAPPSYKKSVTVAEIETILCKWKGHLAGRYPVGHDIEEIRHGFSDWSHNAAAQTFLRSLPPLVQSLETA